VASHRFLDGLEHLLVHHILVTVAQLDAEAEPLALEMSQVELGHIKGALRQGVGQHPTGAQVTEKLAPIVQLAVGYFHGTTYEI